MSVFIKIVIIVLILLLTVIIYNYIQSGKKLIFNQENIQNKKMREYNFLAEMYRDSYFLVDGVDMIKNVLIKLCLDIEEQEPKTLDDLYKLTHNATEEINEVETVMDIETVARECISEDFYQIAQTYGFENADLEELVATRDW